MGQGEDGDRAHPSELGETPNTDGTGWVRESGEKWEKSGKKVEKVVKILLQLQVTDGLRHRITELES